MKWTTVRLLVSLVCGCALMFSLGCVVAADALNPGFFSSLGIDPGTIFPARGTIIVSFTNNTGYPAIFYAFESVDAVDLTVDSHNFSVVVPPNGSRNEVLTCPVGLFSPGQLDGSFTIGGAAAALTTPDGVEEIEYAWPLTSPEDFACGAVIDIQVYDPADLTRAIPIVVRVIPGR